MPIIVSVTLNVLVLKFVDSGIVIFVEEIPLIIVEKRRESGRRKQRRIIRSEQYQTLFIFKAKE